MQERLETQNTPVPSRLRLNVETVRRIKYTARDGVPAPESSICSISDLTLCCGSNATRPGCCP